MLVPRSYKPNANDILYHYCDAAAFLAICTSKKIRLSDVFSMGDFMEMHWGYYIWEQAASELLDEVGKEFLDRIDEVIHSSGIRGLLLASCFSLDGDVLSQWRAYADDGRGYAIGFSASDLAQLPVRALKVLYDKPSQIAEVKNVIKGLHEADKSETDKSGSWFREICYLLAYDLAALKNPAFVEEKEIRLVHLLDLEPSNNSLKLVDGGGETFGKPSDGVEVMFRMRSGVPVAFIDQDFADSRRVSPIKEVIVGPANDGLLTGVSVFLETIGIGSVVVKKSRASYRS